MTKLVVVTDRGALHAYRSHKDELNGAERLEPCHSFRPDEPHQRLGDRVSDQAGRFPAGGNGVLSQGDRHNIILETEQRVLKLLAARIDQIAREHGCKIIHFAAPSEINARIVGNLDPATRERIKKNIPADLTKARREELLERFKAA